MLIDFDQPSAPDRFDADLCIVGAGAAGITIAREFIGTKTRVLLLEGGGADITEDSQNLYKMRCSNKFFLPTDECRLRFLGGTTNHWEGTCNTLDPIDFEKRDWMPLSGWPFPYAELDRHYDRAFKVAELGRRFRDEAPFRRKLGEAGRKLAAAGLLPRLVYVSPPTRFGERYGAEIEGANNITLVLRANLMQVNEATDRSAADSLTICNYGGRQAEVRAKIFVLALGGLENARAMLLSDQVTPGGIGNENGLVGRCFMEHPGLEAAIVKPTAEFRRTWDRLGTNFEGRHFFALQLPQAILRKAKMTNARIALTPTTKIYASEGIESVHQIQKALNSEKDELKSTFHHLGNVIADAPTILDGWWRKSGHDGLFDSSDEDAGYLVEAMTEQSPSLKNRISLTSERDALGLRKAKLDWNVEPRDRGNIKLVVEQIARAFGASGLGAVRSLVHDDDTGRTFEERLGFGRHHMGSTRAATGPKEGVVDENMRIFGRRNLFVAGSSVFPTGSHVPPTVTIVALALRLADHLKAELNRNG